MQKNAQGHFANTNLPHVWTICKKNVAQQQYEKFAKKIVLKGNVKDFKKNHPKEQFANVLSETTISKNVICNKQSLHKKMIQKNSLEQILNSTQNHYKAK